MSDIICPPIHNRLQGFAKDALAAVTINPQAGMPRQWLTALRGELSKLGVSAADLDIAVHQAVLLAFQRRLQLVASGQSDVAVRTRLSALIVAWRRQNAFWQMWRPKLNEAWEAETPDPSSRFTWRITTSGAMISHRINGSLRLRVEQGCIIIEGRRALRAYAPLAAKHVLLEHIRRTFVRQGANGLLPDDLPQDLARIDTARLANTQEACTEADLLALHIPGLADPRRRWQAQGLTWADADLQTGTDTYKALLSFAGEAATVARRIGCYPRNSAPWVCKYPAFWQGLQERQHLMRDLRKYRTAAFAVHMACKNIPEPSPWDTCPSGVPEVLRQLENWASTYAAPETRTTRSLRRVLMNPPKGLPRHFLSALRHAEVSRPIHSVEEFIAHVGTQVPARAERLFPHILGRHAPDHPNLPLIRRATSTDLREAYDIMMTPDVEDHGCGAMQWAMGFTTPPPNVDGWINLISWLLDFPETVHCTIIGLAKRSAVWHRNMLRHARMTRATRISIPPSTALPVPPWQPRCPKNGTVIHLATAGALEEESTHMRHCVRSYARAALGRRSVLFHCELGEDKATVETDWNGRVIQAKGPWNKSNALTLWAIKTGNLAKKMDKERIA